MEGGGVQQVVDGGVWGFIWNIICYNIVCICWDSDYIGVW